MSSGDLRTRCRLPHTNWRGRESPLQTPQTLFSSRTPFHPEPAPSRPAREPTGSADRRGGVKAARVLGRQSMQFSDTPPASPQCAWSSPSSRNDRKPLLLSFSLPRFHIHRASMRVFARTPGRVIVAPISLVLRLPTGPCSWVTQSGSHSHTHTSHSHAHTLSLASQEAAAASGHPIGPLGRTRPIATASFPPGRPLAWRQDSASWTMPPCRQLRPPAAHPPAHHPRPPPLRRAPQLRRAREPAGAGQVATDHRRRAARTLSPCSTCCCGVNCSASPR